MLMTVFSDSHGDRENMRRALLLRRPDQIVFLGDGVRDAEAVFSDFPEIPAIILRGNCDYTAIHREESALFELEGVRIFAAHGHNHGVKLNMDGFLNSVWCSGAVLGLYGHTHEPRVETRRGRTLLNPGSVGSPYRPTYALVTLEKGSFHCELLTLEEAE